MITVAPSVHHNVTELTEACRVLSKFLTSPHVLSNKMASIVTRDVSVMVTSLSWSRDCHGGLRVGSMPSGEGRGVM